VWSGGVPVGSGGVFSQTVQIVASEQCSVWLSVSLTTLHHVAKHLVFLVCLLLIFWFA